MLARTTHLIVMRRLNNNLTEPTNSLLAGHSSSLLICFPHSETVLKLGYSYVSLGDACCAR